MVLQAHRKAQVARPGWGVLLLLAACGGGGGGTEPDGAPDPGGEAADPTAPDSPQPFVLPEGFRPYSPAYPQDEPPPEIVHLATGLELVLVPAGSFEYGSTDADPWHAGDEAPAFTATLAAFYLGRTEVTQRAWQAGGGTAGRAAGPEHPIVDVTWDQVNAWCRANGLDLPTEAQWEYAASGPENRIFPWGDADERWRCNALGTNVTDLWDRTAPVASFPQSLSWCKVYDLAGNVSEWCRDLWHDDLSGLAEHNPERRAERPAGATRAVRGGAFSCRSPYCLRGAYRDGLEPEVSAGNLGFRVALGTR